MEEVRLAGVQEVVGDLPCMRRWDHGNDGMRADRRAERMGGTRAGGEGTAVCCDAGSSSDLVLGLLLCRQRDSVRRSEGIARGRHLVEVLDQSDMERDYVESLLGPCSHLGSKQS